MRWELRKPPRCITPDIDSMSKVYQYDSGYSASAAFRKRKMMFSNFKALSILCNTSSHHYSQSIRTGRKNEIRMAVYVIIPSFFMASVRKLR
jgi:hypothetical protein